MRNVMTGWYHSIVAIHKNEVITITTRDFGHEIAGVLHKFLGVTLNTEKKRRVNERRSYTYAELTNVLLLFTDYQQYKEIEFLKVCLDYFSKGQNIERIDFTFMNE